MSFRDARLRILEDHRALRSAVGEVETLRSRLEAGDEDAARQLLEAGSALCRTFADHLSLEDRELVPAVRALAGPRVAEQIVEEHREQRELLDYLVGHLSHPERPGVLLARELHHFATLLREDMREEEALLLRLDPSPETRTSR